MTLFEQLKARLNAADKFGAMEGTIEAIIDEFKETWQCRKCKHRGAIHGKTAYCYVVEGYVELHFFCRDFEE